ncbi:putative Kinesin-like protein [Seiridium cardinale]
MLQSPLGISHRQKDIKFVGKAEKMPSALQEAFQLHGGSIVHHVKASATEVKNDIKDLKTLIQKLGVSQSMEQSNIPDDWPSEEVSKYKNLYESGQEEISRLEALLESEKARTKEKIQELLREKEDVIASSQADLEELRESREASSLNETALIRQVQDEQERCRRLFGRIQAMKGNIRVMCRIRPLLLGESAEEAVDFGPPEKGELSNHWARILLPVQRKRVTGEVYTDTKEYDFERVFGPRDTNAAVFDELRDLTQVALQGGKVCIFSYGQSGSGKTYTMGHQADIDYVGLNDGIMPQTLAMMFREAEESREYKYKFLFTAVEIYKETLYDLELADDQGRNAKVPGNDPHAATKFPVTRLKGVLGAGGILNQIRNNRAVGATNLNDQSSRSHLVFSVYVSREALLPGPDRGKIEQGLLHLIDLAGSERVGEAGTEGARRAEGVAINQSLLSLNMAITALGEGKQPVPNSALTRMLHPCFVGDAKVVMFVNVSPLKRDLAVSLQTLQKAQEASKARVAAMKRTAKSQPAAAPTATKSASPPKSSHRTSASPAATKSTSSSTASHRPGASSSVPGRQSKPTTAAPPPLRRTHGISPLRPSGGSSSASHSAKATPSRR